VSVRGTGLSAVERQAVSGGVTCLGRACAAFRRVSVRAWFVAAASLGLAGRAAPASTPPAPPRALRLTLDRPAWSGRFAVTPGRVAVSPRRVTVSPRRVTVPP
jgi:hypothetical protein